MSTEEHQENIVQKIAKRCLATFVLLAVSIGVSVFSLGDAWAATPPRIIMYQGRLLNSNGVPVSDTTASVSFALFDAASAGTCLWSNNSTTCASTVARTVTLTAGLFSEPLGDTTATYAAIPITVFQSATVYLQVVVNGETLTPRKQMLATPYALNSDTLDGLDATTTGSTVTAIPAFDANGNLVITGSPQGTSINQGSLYINPATGVVAANEILFGVAVNGSARFAVDGEGDAVVVGTLNANGGIITSSGVLAISSGGVGALTLTAGSGIVSTPGNFAIGGTSLTAHFSVNAATATTRFGNGSLDPIINFHASDGTNTMQLSYDTSDSISLTGGKFSHSGNGDLPAVSGGTSAYFVTTENITTTSGSNLANLKMFGALGSITYSGIEGSGTTSHEVTGVQGSLTVSGGSTVLTYGSGIKGSGFNNSTNAGLLESGGFLAGVTGIGTQNAGGGTLLDMRGVYGDIVPQSGTITNAYAVTGRFTSSGGTITTAFAVHGKNDAAGTSRYGVFGSASGGTNNYAGYFTGARTQIDGDESPDTPTIATTAGELYVAGDVESRGSILFGDTTGVDTFTFTSNATTEDVGKFAADGLTSGVALRVARADNGTNFTGNLLLVEQNDVGAGTTGTAAQITQLGTGNAIGLRIRQSTTSAHSANVTGNNALVLDIDEAASADNAIVMRSDADGTPDTEFRVTSAGDAFVDGAFTGGGADFAEYFSTQDSVLGDQHMVCYDVASTESVKRCEAGNTQVIGVISTNPAFIGNIVGDGTEDYRNDSRYRLVGLIGQIDTKVTTADGAIAIGDPITTSATTPGYGAKARGPVRIAGFALEALSSGTGTIRVLVNPQWYGGDVLTRSGSATQVGGSLAIAATTAATASVNVADSSSLELRGSAWNGSAAQTVGMSLKTTVSALDEYRLSIMSSDGNEVALVNDSGDLALAGKFYPSDRGVLQRNKYIYYDGSAGPGGDFIRTNASGWATGSYDFAEMFPSPESLSPGEVVVFGDDAEQIKRSTGETYSRTIAGIVSTRPGFLAGDNRDGSYPIALAGRVPTFVSGENGSINIGDPLTTSSLPGYVMKATEPGPIVGYASEAFEGTVGSIVVYVNVSYFDGTPTDEAPAADNVISHLATDIENFDIVGVLNFNGGSLLAIGSMTGANDAWRLESSGDFVTSGRFIQRVRTSEGVDVETYLAATPEMTVQLSGTTTLDHGRAEILFDDISPTFSDIIDSNPSYRVLVTPYGATGALYVMDRTVDGFTIAESGASSDGVSVDWLVVAYRRDFAPVVTPSAPLVDPSSVSSAVESETSPLPPSDEGVGDEVTPEAPIGDNISSDPAVSTEEEPVLEPSEPPVFDSVVTDPGVSTSPEEETPAGASESETEPVSL